MRWAQISLSGPLALTEPHLLKMRSSSENPPSSIARDRHRWQDPANFLESPFRITNFGALRLANHPKPCAKPDVAALRH